MLSVAPETFLACTRAISAWNTSNGEPGIGKQVSTALGGASRRATRDAQPPARALARLGGGQDARRPDRRLRGEELRASVRAPARGLGAAGGQRQRRDPEQEHEQKRDRKSTRLNSSHPSISYAVF